MNPNYIGKVLNEYAQFIEKVRYFTSENDDNPIGQAIDWCIENHILEDFLRRRKPEVLKNMTIDMTFERREELIRIEEREEGYKAGLEDGESIGESRGKLAMLINLVNKGLLTITSASLEANMTEEKFLEYINNMKVES